MKVASLESGISVTWGRIHKDSEGNLISKEVLIDAPKLPECMKPMCLFRYSWQVFTWACIVLYHEQRVNLAEKYRHHKIPIKYRDGEPSPETAWQAFKWMFKMAVLETKLR